MPLGCIVQPTRQYSGILQPLWMVLGRGFRILLPNISRCPWWVLDATAYQKCGDLYLDQGERWPQLRDVCILLLILCDAGFFTGFMFFALAYTQTVCECALGVVMLAVMILDSERLLSPAVTTATTIQQIQFVKENHPMLMLEQTYWIHVWCRCWSNYKQLSKNQELAMRAMCVSCIFSSGATDGGWNSGNWCWNSLEEDASSEGWDLFAIKLFEKEWFLAKKIEVWRMSFKKLGKGMQDSISTQYQDYHRFSLI